VSINDPNSIEQHQRKLETIEAQLTGQDKTIRLGLMWLSALGFVLLALLEYIITRL
jgi:hypothetical protein